MVPGNLIYLRKINQNAAAIIIKNIEYSNSNIQTFDFM